MCYIDKIKVLRKQHKHSQKDMAELLQTTQQQYSKYENMQQELPIRHLITICKYYNVSADWLLGLETEIKAPKLVIKGEVRAAKSSFVNQMIQDNDDPIED